MYSIWATAARMTTLSQTALRLLLLLPVCPIFHWHCMHGVICVGFQRNEAIGRLKLALPICSMIAFGVQDCPSELAM